MSDAFDAYHTWLGIAPQECPPNHYRLLGIPLFESDPTVIEIAADRQMGHLRSFQLGAHAALCQKLLNEVASARVCLLSPMRKEEYDRELRQKVEPKRAVRLVDEPAASQQPLADFLPPDLVAQSDRVATGTSPRAKMRRKKPNSSPMVLVACAAAAVAVVVFGAVAWLLGGKGGSDRAASRGGPEQRLTSAATAPRPAALEPSIKPSFAQPIPPATPAATPPEPAPQPTPETRLPETPPPKTPPPETTPPEAPPSETPPPDTPPPETPPSKTPLPEKAPPDEPDVPLFPPREGDETIQPPVGPQGQAADEEAVKVYRAAQGSVVALENAEGGAAGIVLDAKGTVLTNAHVVASPLPLKCKVEVRRGQTRQSVVYRRVKILGVHPTQDLALVRLDPAEHSAALQPARLSRRKAAPGQRVYAIGNPVGAGMVLDKTITSGMLSGVDRVIDGLSYYQISAPINPGNSGGPLCDKTGAVIGLVTLKSTDAENVGFAIPLDTLKTTEFIPLDQRRSNPQQSQRHLAQAEKYHEMALDARQRLGPSAPEVRKLDLSAARYYHLAILDDPGNPTVYYNLGTELRKLNSDEVAAAYLIRAIDLAPWGRDRESSDAYRELGLALAKQKKKDEASAAWREGVAKFPSKGAKIWEDLAIFHANDAVDVFKTAYAAAVVVHLADPYTRIPVAQELLRDFGGRLSPMEKRKLDAAIARIPQDLRLGEAAAEKARSARKPYITEAFARYMQDSPIVKGR